MKTIETERLILREPRLTDAEDMFEYAKSPNIGPNAGWPPHKDIEATKNILQTLFIDVNNAPEKKTEERVLVLKENGKIIGTLGLHGINRLREDLEGQIEIGYVLSESYWGRGLMPEAVAAMLAYCFEDLKLQMVSVGHFDFNDKSRRVIEKSGFTYEGKIRRVVKHVINGTFHDLLSYSMTRREYLVKKSEKMGLRLLALEEIDKESYLDYYNEESDEKALTGGTMNPSAADLKGESYEDWLKTRLSFRTTVRDGWVTDDTFFLADSTGRILGAINIRHELNDYLMNFGGHIGYGIRPSERGKGYAPIQLALALAKIKELGLNIDRALITCNDTNPGSAKTIEACGGWLENTVEEEGKPGNMIRRYWIEV